MVVVVVVTVVGVEEALWCRWVWRQNCGWWWWRQWYWVGRGV